MGMGTTRSVLCRPTPPSASLAPILLFMLRFLQGSAVGGQWGGAVLLATEYAPGGSAASTAASPRWACPSAVLFSNIIFLIICRLSRRRRVGRLGLAYTVPPQRAPDRARRSTSSSAGGHAGLQAPAGVPRAAPVGGGATRGRRGRRLAGVGGSADLSQGDRCSRPVPFFVLNGNFYVLITCMLDYGTRRLGLSQSTVLAAVLISSARPAHRPSGLRCALRRVGRRTRLMAGAVLLGLWASSPSGRSWTREVRRAHHHRARRRRSSSLA